MGTRGRCPETDSLEFHHVTPFAYGGKNTADNIQLRCRAHNQYEADLQFPLEPKTAHGSSQDPGTGNGADYAKSS